MTQWFYAQTAENLWSLRFYFGCLFSGAVFSLLICPIVHPHPFGLYGT
jgi:hypothetical protein